MDVMAITNPAGTDLSRAETALTLAEAHLDMVLGRPHTDDEVIEAGRAVHEAREAVQTVFHALQTGYEPAGMTA